MQPPLLELGLPFAYVTNYKINKTSLWLDKFTTLVVSFCFENYLKTLYTCQIFDVLLNFTSVTMRDALILLLEKVLNDEYMQRLACQRFNFKNS